MEARELTAFVTDKAVALIRSLHNPPIGAKEFSGGWCPERCDAILFTSGASFMIETKISRSDFLADSKKAHRSDGCGVGNYRYYACPTGLIKPEELPEKWGLIYVNADQKQARATMPVGYGGRLWNKKKDTKHPTGGWTVQGYELYGTTEINEYGNEVCVNGKSFKFDNPDFEREFLFALATRYKKQNFMENIL